MNVTSDYVARTAAGESFETAPELINGNLVIIP